MHLIVAGICFLFLGNFLTSVHSGTDSNDVSALNVLQKSVTNPQPLSRWKADGGDPCGESWKGIKCSGSHVTEINLSGLSLSGSLGYQLNNLKSVKNFDVSKNNLNNDIPYQLPPNMDHLDLSSNAFSGALPFSISMMKKLKYLNLSHNQINTELNDLFNDLGKLESLDVSSNQFKGNLPQSMRALTGLKQLFMQNNKFTGQINVLEHCKKLKEVNLGNNKFSGWIPASLTRADDVQLEGNKWSTGPAPPGMVSSTKIKTKVEKKWKVGLKWAMVAVLILGVLLGIAILIAVISRRQKSTFSSSLLDENEAVSPRKPFNSFSRGETSAEVKPEPYKEFNEGKTSGPLSKFDNTQQSSPRVGFLRGLSNRMKPFSRTLSQIAGSPRSIDCFSLADLQTATSNFAAKCLLGDGLIGRVYKANTSDGKVYAVKEIKPSLCQAVKIDDFSETIQYISKLRHQSIVGLIGYCSEQQKYYLVYNFMRNGSLHEFLHLSDEFSKPLTWNTRVRIALGTAEALTYLHESCYPPMIHMNIKSSNILLDMELNPYLSDCGLDVFYQKKEDLSPGYNPPNRAKASMYTHKSDVYSFGVVMLELLTGRLPLDSSKPASEQSLVEWATPQLHDTDAVERMADPSLRGLYPEKSLHQFADIVVMCVKREPESRPSMSEVSKALAHLVQR